MGFFAQHLTGKLGEMLEEARSTSPDERMSLLEEIDLSRATALEALRLFQAAQESKKDSTRLLAVQAVHEALNNVSRVVERAARTKTLTEGVVRAEFIEYLSGKISRIILDEVEGVGGMEMVERILKKINSIEMPNPQNSKYGIEMASQIRQAMEKEAESVGALEAEEGEDA